MRKGFFHKVGKTRGLPPTGGTTRKSTPEIFSRHYRDYRPPSPCSGRCEVVNSVSLPPFVSRRGLSNTNQRLSLQARFWLGIIMVEGNRALATKLTRYLIYETQPHPEPPARPSLIQEPPNKRPCRLQSRREWDVPIQGHVRRSFADTWEQHDNHRPALRQVMHSSH